jgi:hypothetical protein
MSYYWLYIVMTVAVQDTFEALGDAIRNAQIRRRQ